MQPVYYNPSLLDKFKIFLRKLSYRFFQTESNLVKHAEFELDLAGIKGSDMDDLMRKQVLEIIKLFSKQGHSGFSASYLTFFVNKLMKYEPLTPLTGEYDEWNQISEGTYQNKRCSNIFKKDNLAYNLDGFVFEYPDGSKYTNKDSIKYISFPYTPEPPSIIKVDFEGHTI